MRRLILLVLPLIMLVGCGSTNTDSRLDYQNKHLVIDASFILDGDEFDATLELEAARFDETDPSENGKMLMRNAVLTINDNSLISGVSFELTDGNAYVSSGALKIPLSDDSVISGIYRLVSLFCISDDKYHSSQKQTREGASLELAKYVSGDNYVNVLLDTKTGLPLEIEAYINGQSISAKINKISAE